MCSDTRDESHAKPPTDAADPIDMSTDDPQASTSAAQQHPVIIKASNGRTGDDKIKISTLVKPSGHAAFMAAYGPLLKSTMTLTMRKKDKRKKDAKKAAAAVGTAASSSKSSGKKGSAVAAKPVIPKVTAPRRGAGHAKRQRQEKARQKAVRRMLDMRQRQKKQSSSKKTS